MASREIRDPIHGFIDREDIEGDIIDSPVFQRLRKIKQLALASLVYPGAVHTRFDHSIGAMHVAGQIAKSIKLDSDETRLVRLATLLHDIGHGPFSHVSEPVLEKFYDKSKIQISGKQQIHEKLTEAIIREDPCLCHVLSQKERDRIVGVLNGSYGDTVLKHIVSGPLDADKQDYLLRDSYFCGVKYGVYDLARLTNTLKVYRDSDDRYLVLNEDGVNALEQFVLAKYYMTSQVYRHKVRLITDSMIQRALELGIQTDKIDWLRKLYAYDGSPEYIREYISWNDDRLTNEVLSDNTTQGYAKSIFQALAKRKLHKRIFNYRIREFDNALLKDRLSKLTPEDKSDLEGRIARYLGKDPNLIIVNTFSIKSVRTQAKNNSEASIMVIGPEPGKPYEFEDKSVLFGSIKEAFQERFIEVYAPVIYQDEKEKRIMKAQYHRAIHDILKGFMQADLYEGRGLS